MPSLEALIQEEIRRSGPISFARFMHLALYCPTLGYYETHDRTIGRSGDFFTSVSVGEVFGHVLGCQFAAWLNGLPGPDRHLVECGAHDGRLSHDLLSWIDRHAPDLPKSLSHWIVEPSPVRRERQRRTLGDFARQVRWVDRLEELPPVHGVIFSNELLDAFPVRVFRWQAAGGVWRELGVGLEPEAGGLGWHWLETVTAATEREFREAGFVLPPELLEVLPDGFQLELCPEAVDWWAKAGGRLARGYLVAFDYGMLAEELIRPERAQGTLRAYAKHQVRSELLADPGQQDLTAHVNFSAVISAGERAGLVTDGLSRQGECLVRWVQAAMQRGELSDWNAGQLRQFQTLVHPAHLGHVFRALVQRRG